MTLSYIPEIENTVLTSCADLISQFNFTIHKISKNDVVLSSQKCGIRISAAVSPIGEREIDIDFFNPSDSETKRQYHSHTFLLYINTRSEPDDVLRRCVEEEGRDETFDETIRIALKCFAVHTLKYRRDILNGDFTSWLPKSMS